MIGIFGKTLRNHKKDTNEKLSQSFMKLITRLIVIDIAPLTLLFYNIPLADLWLPAVKRYYFQYKLFLGFVWLTSNHIFGSGDFWHKWPSWFSKILKLPFLNFFFGQFRHFQKFNRMQENEAFITLKDHKEGFPMHCVDCLTLEKQTLEISAKYY